VAAKYTTILAAPLLLVATSREQVADDGGARLRGLFARPVARRLVLGATIILAVPVLFYAPWFEGIGTFGPVLRWVSGPVLNNYWPEAPLSSVVHWIVGPSGAGFEAVWDPLLSIVKLLAKAVLVVLIGFECWRLRTIEDALEGSARIFVFFLLVVTTWVMPWYYSWPLAISAPLGWGSMTVRVCAGLTFTAMVSMYQRQLGHFVVSDGAWFLVLPIALAALPSLIRRARSPRHISRIEGGSPFDAEPKRVAQRV